MGGAGGLVLLFHGASGVGKTMMANAVAKHVGRKVLLINFPSLGSNEAGTAIRFIFRYVTALPCPALPCPALPCPAQQMPTRQASAHGCYCFQPEQLLP